MKKTYLSHMTWCEVEDIVKGDPCVLIPNGTVETQNRHGPMGLDYMIAQRVAEEVAEKCNAVIAPTIPYGISETFWGFPGALYLSKETFQSVIYDLVSSLLESGFRHILFLSNHSPNDLCVKNVMTRIRKERGYMFPSIAPSVVAKTLAVREGLYPEGNPKIFGHGSEPNSSLCAYLWPELLRKDLLKEPTKPTNCLAPLTMGGKFSAVYDGIPVPFHGMLISECMPDGGKGQPLCDPEIGRQMYEKTVDWFAAFIEQYRQTDSQVEKVQ